MHIALGSEFEETAFEPTRFNDDYTVWLKNRLLSLADTFYAMMLVVFMLYLNQGLAVLHAVIAGKQLNAVWLYLVYILMFFIPHIVVLLAMAGLADTWIDFRRRLVA